MELITILKDWVIPVASVILSVWFAASAKKDADRTQIILDQINKAINGWQSEIMGSATNILNSMPLVIDGKEKLTKAEALRDALNALIHDLNVEGFPNQKIELIRQIGKLLGSQEK